MMADDEDPTPNPDAPGPPGPTDEPAERVVEHEREPGLDSLGLQREAHANRRRSIAALCLGALAAAAAAVAIVIATEDDDDQVDRPAATTSTTPAASSDAGAGSVQDDVRRLRADIRALQRRTTNPANDVEAAGEGEEALERLGRRVTRLRELQEDVPEQITRLQRRVATLTERLADATADEQRGGEGGGGEDETTTTP